MGKNRLLRPVTAKEIAAELGISRQAVSAVLSGSAPNCVIAETRKKIQDIASAKGYRANTAALRLAGYNTRTVGVVLSNYGLQLKIPELLSSELERRNYTSITVITDPRKSRAAVLDLIGRGVDGIIIGTEHDFSHSDISTPMVKLNFKNYDVAVDFEHAGEIAVRHLLEHGHQNFAFLEIKQCFSSDQKFNGVRRTAGKTHVGRLSLSHNEHFSDDLQNLIKKKKVTAFVCSDDILAARMIVYLTQSGYRVPEDLAVTGYGGYAFAGAMIPSLATVIYPAALHAEKAVAVLFDKIERKLCRRIEKPLLLPLSFYPGRSCGCPQTVMKHIIGEGGAGSLCEFDDIRQQTECRSDFDPA